MSLYMPTLIIYIFICVGVIRMIIVCCQFGCFTVAAQEGPGIVIANPGQDVELLCNVTENSTTLTEGWLVNNDHIE